jgi:hypothetical protein
LFKNKITEKVAWLYKAVIRKVCAGTRLQVGLMCGLLALKGNRVREATRGK